MLPSGEAKASAALQREGMVISFILYFSFFEPAVIEPHLMISRPVSGGWEVIIVKARDDDSYLSKLRYIGFRIVSAVQSVEPTAPSISVLSLT